ncbi:hypothetical protein [Turneriella parva]|uniref:Uncharacterized protein n=1 Tax=Turneriella parva (strain ATCC BAA-1111 / DSM 21527 / NCTC 11395 / H) TaxID=869212 RepID=I4B3R7_TURPD|nr:hypothetical protein [Turneriella parva]AFM11924.1 hypothetical protein Turpa_1276 [Turneriella parva DSM 21527]
MIFLIISAPALQLNGADKAGTSGTAKEPIPVTFSGLRDERTATSCLNAINRNRQRQLVIPEKGDGDYQIVIEKKRPGYQVRVERMGTALKTGRALFDYEVCIAAAAIAREAIADE